MAGSDPMGRLIEQAEQDTGLAPGLLAERARTGQPPQVDEIVEGSVDEHELATSNVHGVGASQIESKAGAQARVDDHGGVLGEGAHVVYALPGGSAPGDAAAEGVADEAARADHRHGREAVSPAVADFAMVISNPPTQAEVQALADRFNLLLAAARANGWLAT